MQSAPPSATLPEWLAIISDRLEAQYQRMEAPFEAIFLSCTTGPRTSDQSSHNDGAWGRRPVAVDRW